MKRDERLPTRRESPADFLIYQTEGGATKIEVRLDNETVWLTQRLMAELFQKDVRTISEHISNVYEEGELVPEATIRKYRTVQREGEREVARLVEHYNLDMIISVGYRVKSHVATRFRMSWQSIAPRRNTRTFNGGAASTQTVNFRISTRR